MRRQITSLRGLLGLTLIVSAILFVVGTSIERSKASSEAKPHSEAAAGSGTSTEGATHTESATPAEAAGAHHGEKLVGIDIESIPAIVLGALASVLLAALVFWRRERYWLVAAVLFGLVFAAGDAREVSHQLNEHRSGLALVAAILNALHLAVSALAAFVISRHTGEGSPAAAPAS